MKKLKLNVETLRRLESAESGVVGGVPAWVKGLIEQSQANGNFTCYWLASWTAPSNTRV